MCVAQAAAGVSLITTVIGGLSQASAQRSEGRYQNQLLQRQAEQRDQAARDTILDARDAEVSKRLETGRLKAEQVARFASQGVDVSSGSPLRVAEDTAFFGEVDALRIRTRGAREAESLFYQGELDRVAGRNAERAGKNKANSTLLTTAGKVAGSAFTFSQKGVF